MDTITAKAATGTITFDGATITIQRPWVGSAQGRSIKHISLDSVHAIQYTPAKRWAPMVGLRGYIAFTLAGGIERQARQGSQIARANRDENAVVFQPTKRQAAEFEALYQAIMQAKGINTAEPAETPVQ